MPIPGDAQAPTPPPSDMISEVEKVKSIVAKHFPVYDVRVNYQAVTLLISPFKETIDQTFDQLRREMDQAGYIPLLNYKGGEYIITVVRKDRRRTRGIWLNLALLIITTITTVLAGAALWASYDGSDNMFALDNLLWGAITFAVPLLLILGTHELSHYLAAKRHGVAASLPFFIPSIPPLGTLGAFISLRDPIPDRKALVDIGIAGPIGGLLVTLPITVIGLWLTAQGEPGSGLVPDDGAMAIMVQPLMQLFTMLIPIPENVTLHPTAFAAWVGFLVTAINLLPAGQLDGGHVARGLLGENAKYLSYVTIFALVALGLLFYSGWLLFGLIVIFLGVRHPQPLNNVSSLSLSRKALGILAILLLLVTFLPVPLVSVLPDYSYEVSVQEGTNITIEAGTTVLLHIEVRNTGNTNNNFSMLVVNAPSSWNCGLYLLTDSGENATNWVSFPLGYEQTQMVVLALTVPASHNTAEYHLNLNLSSYNPSGQMQESSSIAMVVNVT